MVPDASRKWILMELLKAISPQVLQLFKNNITPSAQDTVDDYREADFTGYGSRTLMRRDWTVDGAVTKSAAQTFSSGADQAPQKIYGYFLVEAASGKLLWSERFSNGPYTVQNNGDSITVQPILKGMS